MGSLKNLMTMIKILLMKLLPKTMPSFQDKVITIISSVAELQELKKSKELSNTSEDHFLISTGKEKQLCFMKMLLLFSAKSLAFLKEMATLDTKDVLKMKPCFWKYIVSVMERSDNRIALLIGAPPCNK